MILISVLIFTFYGCGKEIEIQNEETITAEETTSNTVRVTFPEGYTISEMAEKLEENGVCNAADFLTEADNPEYLAEFGFDISDQEDRAFLLEGYLFPDTYDFYRNENISSVIKKFLRNTKSKLTDDLISEADALGYSLDEILTIASIIQEEASNTSEAPMVSSVIHNRLGSSSFKRLQCDACSFYLMNSVKQHVDEGRYDELCELYNTYTCTGLPAGPICNPGIEAINAALNPEKSDYYYFVTDSDNNYYYSSTWEEHSEKCVEFGITD